MQFYLFKMKIQKFWHVKEQRLFCNVHTTRQLVSITNRQPIAPLAVTGKRRLTSHFLTIRKYKNHFDKHFYVGQLLKPVELIITAARLFFVNHTVSRRGPARIFSPQKLMLGPSFYQGPLLLTDELIFVCNTTIKMILFESLNIISIIQNVFDTFAMFIKTQPPKIGL